ncbi:sensor histidine kinase [Inquilinus sp. NPDC058860]|uniref:sensor histidine kinase n=1 Tax=Inquilinus sp. NPDC058860 TaxID=3346652 RepID=UPI003695630E
MLQRLRTRPDSEHEMRFNGVIFGTAILVYLLGTVGHDSGIIIVPPVYIAFNLAVLAHILWHPGICRPRRIFSIFADLGALFLVMHIGGEVTTILFPIYLWVILGNGFRFGIPFLALATGVGLASFGAVVATTPFWGGQTALSAGLFGGIVLVPLAAVPLIRQLSKAKRQAEAANQETNFILASVSHELRTPLTAIVGTGSVLQHTKLDPAQREMTRRVVSAGRRLLKMIDDVPEISHPRRAEALRAQRHAAPGKPPPDHDHTSSR